MKKRIAAMLLAAVLVLNLISDNAKPARAVAPAVAYAIPSLVSVLYGVMTGCFDECAEALGYCLQAAADGVEVTADFLGDCFVGDEDTPSWFVTGWCQITNTVTGWFDSGEISLSEDGKVYMNYYNYLQLCEDMYDYLDVTLYLGSDRDHCLVTKSFNAPLLLNNLPKIRIEEDGFERTSYAPVYYSDSKIYIARSFFLFSILMQEELGISIYNGSPCYSLITNSNSAPTIAFMDSTNSLVHAFIDYAGMSAMLEYALADWWLYDEMTGALSVVDNTQVDRSLTQGYLVCGGYLNTFVNTISTISTTTDTSQVDDLSDPLDDVLVLNPNPGLVVDTDPTITDPRDAVLITDVPAVADMTLTQAMSDTKPLMDMEVPSSIWNKFPFSLPFDFYRLLTIFVAEPKAPVFRIPISNVNVDMSAFEGNQTLGQFANGETTELLFEIDEEIVIDLSNIPLVQGISYSCFIVGFIVLLIFVTSKLIHH